MVDQVLEVAAGRESVRTRGASNAAPNEDASTVELGHQVRDRSCARGLGTEQDGVLRGPRNGFGPHSNDPRGEYWAGADLNADRGIVRCAPKCSLKQKRARCVIPNGFDVVVVHRDLRAEEWVQSTHAGCRSTSRIGGTMRTVTAADITLAEQHVRACVDTPIPTQNEDGMEVSESLLPYGKAFPKKARRFYRAQEHMLDEMLFVMFEKPGEASQISNVEKAKVYLLLWVAVQAIDSAWTAPWGAPA